MDQAATRRTRQRAATLAEIKAATWADMSATGSVDVSLRSVARELGMAPSAVYRYFTSRDELLTALIIDSFDELTAALQGALDTALADVPVPGGAELFVRVGRAYRDWALTHPLQYRLAFGSPVGGYTGTAETTAASIRSSAVLLQVMARIVAADELDADRVDTLLAPDLRRRLGSWSAALPAPLPEPALAAAMFCWAALHGAIDVAANGHLPPPLAGSAELFEATLRHTVAGVLR